MKKDVDFVQKVFLDTDIGDDIDDAFALALIVCSPELSLQGIATVCGNTPARTRQAQTLLRVAGPAWERIPVATGCPGMMSPKEEMFDGPLKHYCDDAPRPGHDAVALPASKLPAPDPRRGVDMLIETIMGGNGDIVPLCIGPLTHMGMAIILEPRIVRKIPKITLMGGEFRSSCAEHNIAVDPVAAWIVFSSGIPLEILPAYVGGVCAFDDADNARLENLPSPLARYLSATLIEHRKGWGKTVVPFDPLAVMMLVHPDLFECKRGEVKVEPAGTAGRGLTVFKEKSDGRHVIAWDVKRREAVDFILQRIGAGPRTPQP